MLSWLKGKRTVLLALLIEILGIAEARGADLLPDEHVGTFLMVVGGAVGLLRYLTTTPLFQSSAGPRNAVSMVLLVGLLLSTGACRTLQQVGELTPMGRYDVAVAAATEVLEELELQAKFALEDRRSGKLESRDARRRFDRLDAAHLALAASIDAANAAVVAGRDPGSATAQLESARRTARRVLGGGLGE